MTPGLCPRDAFKVGFLRRCVEDGLDRDGIEAAVKAAHDKLAGGPLDTMVNAGKWVGDKAIDITGKALGYGVPLAILTPPLAGAAVGYGLGRAQDIETADVDNVKDQEVLDEYRRQIDRLNRLRTVRDYQKSLPAPRYGARG